MAITRKHRVELGHFGKNYHYFGVMENKTPVGPGLFCLPDESFIMYEDIKNGSVGHGMSLRYSLVGVHSLGHTENNVIFGPQMMFRYNDPITCCYIDENYVASGFNLEINPDGTFYIYLKDAKGNVGYKAIELDDDNNLCFVDNRRKENRSSFCVSLDKSYRMTFNEMELPQFELDRGIIPSTVIKDGNGGYIFDGGTQVYKKSKQIAYKINMSTGYPEFESSTFGYGVRYGDGFDKYFGYVDGGKRTKIGCASIGDRAYLGQFYNNKLDGVVLEYDSKDYCFAMYANGKPRGTVIRFYNDSAVIDKVETNGEKPPYYYVLKADTFDILKMNRKNKVVETYTYPFSATDKQSLMDEAEKKQNEDVYGKQIKLSKDQQKQMSRFEYTTYWPDITITKPKVKMDKIVIPTFVTKILDSAFDSKEEVRYAKEINLSSSVKEIGKFAFSNCYFVTRITFGVTPQLTEIKMGTFNGCNRLTKINLPLSVKIVREGAFSGCKKLKYLSVADDCVVEEGAVPTYCKVVRQAQYGNDLLQEIRCKYNPFWKFVYGIKNLFSKNKHAKKQDEKEDKKVLNKEDKKERVSNKKSTSVKTEKTKKSISLPSVDLGFIREFGVLTWISALVVLMLAGYLIYGYINGSSGVSMEYSFIFDNYNWACFGLVTKIMEMDFGFFIGIIMGLIVLVLGLIALVLDLIIYLLIIIANILYFILSLIFTLLIALVLPIGSIVYFGIRTFMVCRDTYMDTSEKVFNVVLAIVGLVLSILIVLLILA